MLDDDTADGFITIVSGLPRSGTSLMMKMLEADGLTLLTDNFRRPDEDNPGGYYEYAAVKHTVRDAGWVSLARGKVVKVIHALLPHLPANEQYRVLMLERDLEEVVDSQQAMLQRSGNAGAALSRVELIAAYRHQLEEVKLWIAGQLNFRYTTVCFNQLLSKPHSQLAGIADLLARPLNAQAMAAVIDPALYRQRRHGTS
ncbi:MAG: sulfotransferase family protein [Pirellulales bacterium]